MMWILPANGMTHNSSTILQPDFFLGPLLFVQKYANNEKWFSSDTQTILDGGRNNGRYICKTLFPEE